MPPCAQIEIRPNCTSRRAISFDERGHQRAPVAPNGCPIAIEPPITFSGPSPLAHRLGTAEPLGPDWRLEGLDIREHLRRERLVHLDQAEVAASARPARSSALRHGERRSHQQLSARIDRGDGVAADRRQRRVPEGAGLLVAHHQHGGDAPSVSGEALPAVTVP